MLKNKADELMQQLIRFKNGIVADSMAAKGLKYEVNYGVSIINIIEIAKQYQPDNEFAFELYKRPEREAKLAAIYLIKPDELIREELDLLSTQLITDELSEQLCMRVIVKTPYVVDWAIGCCKANNEFEQHAGWLTIGRASAFDSVSVYDIKPFFEFINNADFTSMHVRSALIYALSRFALKSEELKTMVRHWIECNQESENEYKRWVAYESEALLIE